VSTASFVSPNFNATFNFSVLRILRLARILRIVRLVRSLRSLRVLFRSLYVAVPGIANVMFFLGVIALSFGVLGVALFGEVQPPVLPPIKGGGGIRAYANFNNVPNAVLLLLAFLTGEYWSRVMNDLMSVGGAFAWAWLYFLLYIVVVHFILANLLVAVVLDAYFTALKRDLFKVLEADLLHYSYVWRRFDPFASKRITLEKDCVPFLRELGPPLGLNKSARLRDVLKVVNNLELKQSGPQTTLERLKNTSTERPGRTRIAFSHLLETLVYNQYRSEPGVEEELDNSGDEINRNSTISIINRGTFRRVQSILTVNSINAKKDARQDEPLHFPDRAIAGEIIQRLARTIILYKRANLLDEHLSKYSVRRRSVRDEDAVDPSRVEAVRQANRGQGRNAGDHSPSS